MPIQENHVASGIANPAGLAGQLGFALIPAGVGAMLQAHSTEWLGGLLATLALILLALLALRERLLPAQS